MREEAFLSAFRARLLQCSSRARYSAGVGDSSATLPFEGSAMEADSNLLRQVRGFAPNRRSNARRKASLSEKPTEAAMVSRVRFGTERRRRASLRRKFSTNPPGALPNTLLKARLKWLGDMHALRASVLIERSSCKFRMIHGMSSAKRSAG